MRVGYVRIGDFRPLNRHISETVYYMFIIIGIHYIRLKTGFHKTITTPEIHAYKQRQTKYGFFPSHQRSFALFYLSIVVNVLFLFVSMRLTPGCNRTLVSF